MRTAQKYIFAIGILTLASAQGVPLERGLNRYHLANMSGFVEPHGIMEAGEKYEKIELDFFRRCR